MLKYSMLVYLVNLLLHSLGLRYLFIYVPHLCNIMFGMAHEVPMMFL